MKIAYKITILIIIIAISVVSALAYLYVSTPQNITLNGAGATFPFPLIDKWAAEYP
ncbi:MAG: hypothetical protein QXR03_02055 [Candidatus Aenigmatarchaeota archaeon]